MLPMKELFHCLSVIQVAENMNNKVNEQPNREKKNILKCNLQSGKGKINCQEKGITYNN